MGSCLQNKDYVRSHTAIHLALSKTLTLCPFFIDKKPEA